MLFRVVSILLMFFIVLVMSESNKNKVDGLLRTMSKNGIITGKTFHVDDTKKRPAKFKPSWCQLSHEIGPCRDAKERFYYDSTTNECKFFTYGGCRGNRNNFPSLKKCQKTCKV